MDRSPLAILVYKLWNLIKIIAMIYFKILVYKLWDLAVTVQI